MVVLVEVELAINSEMINYTLFFPNDVLWQKYIQINKKLVTDPTRLSFFVKTSKIQTSNHGAFFQPQR